MEFAERLQGVEESATFRWSSLAKEKKVINLTIGRTNFETPEAIKEAAIRAIGEGKIHYTPAKGIPELRKLLVKKLEEENGIQGLDKEKLLVSSGAKQIIFEAVMALIGKGDGVAIPNPSWVSYESIVRIAQGEVLWLPLSAEDNFIPGEEFLSALENSNPKLVMVNSPNNPTGAVYPEKIMKAIVDIVERKDCWLLSDEIYEKILYEGEHFSPASIYPKTITVNGFSKEFSMTGWRLGYAACRDQKLIEKMCLIQSQSISCATSFVQYAALEAFGEGVREEVSRMVKELRSRRDFLVERINKFLEIPVAPGGAFYIFPKLGGDDLKLGEEFLDNGVGVIPGSPFGSLGKGCVRMSYGAVEKEELSKAMDIIGAILQR